MQIFPTFCPFQNISLSSHGSRMLKLFVVKLENVKEHKRSFWAEVIVVINDFQIVAHTELAIYAFIE
jgi:hypothetical protein